jgi:hypothetical protein
MKKLIVLLIPFIFASSASAAIYKWVDKEGVVNFTDDESRVPSAYHNKIEKVNTAKMGSSTPSQTPPGKMVVNVQPEEAGTQDPPITQILIREGDFAVKLAEVLKIGQAKGEAEAESMLAAVGIAPKNGWIADYPVTPDIIGELQDAIGLAVDSGNLGMNREEAVEAFQDLAAGQGLPVKADGRQNPIEPPKYDEESELVSNYYYTQGPPIVTYYPPPWDYYYLYAWVPYPFWYTGFWFPGFFILTDFHVRHGDHCITNHYTDPKTSTSLSVDPATRTTGATATRTPGRTGYRGFSSAAARMGATSIFNRSAKGSTSSQPGNTGSQYRGFRNRSTGSVRSSGRSYGSPSGGTFSAPTTRGPGSFGGFRGGGYPGGFRNPSTGSVRSSGRSYGSPSGGTFSAPSTGGPGSFGGFQDGGYSGGFHGGGGFGGSYRGGHGGGGGGGHR